MNDLIEEFEAGTLAAQREIVGLLSDLYDVRSKRAAADRLEKTLAERVKQYMDLEGLTEIADDERGIRAYYEARSNTKYDVRSMPPELVVWLGQQGLLSLNVMAFRALKKVGPAIELDDTERFAIPEYITALKVEST